MLRSPFDQKVLISLLMNRRDLQDKEPFYPAHQHYEKLKKYVKSEPINFSDASAFGTFIAKYTKNTQRKKCRFPY